VALSVMHAGLPINGEALLWGALIFAMAAMFAGAPVMMHFASRPPKPRPAKGEPEAEPTPPNPPAG